MIDFLYSIFKNTVGREGFVSTVFYLFSHYWIALMNMETASALVALAFISVFIKEREVANYLSKLAFNSLTSSFDKPVTSMICPSLI